MIGEVNGAILPDDLQDDDEEEEHAIDIDIDKTRNTRGIPKLFERCVKLYSLMEEKADSGGAAAYKIYYGSIAPMIEELGVAQSYQSKITTRLKMMGCVEMLKRGSGAAKSVWGLYKTPTIEDFYASDTTGDVKFKIEVKEHDALTQRVNDLIRRVTAVEDWARNNGMVI